MTIHDDYVRDGNTIVEVATYTFTY
jgi:hypothetical protein